MADSQRAPVIVHSTSTHKGMADKVEPWFLPEQYSYFLQNLDPTVPGSRRRRLGTASIGVSTGAPCGLWAAADYSLGSALFVVYSGRLNVLNGAGLQELRASGITLTNNLHMTATGYWKNRTAQYMCQAQPDDSNPSLCSLLAVFNEQNEYSQSPSMAPACIAYTQLRLWAAGNKLSENDETLWWSELNDGLQFSLTNTIQVEPGLGGRITGLIALRGEQPQIVVFKQRALCLFLPRWGSSSAYIPGATDALDTINSEVRVLSGNVGCCSTRSIQYIPGHAIGDVLFLSYEGFRTVRLTDQNQVSGATPPISDDIANTIKRINFNYAHKVVSARVGTYYHCAVPMDEATENTHVITYDLTNGAWYLNTWAAKDLCAALVQATSDQLFMQYCETAQDSGVTGLASGFHTYHCYEGYVDPGAAAIQFQEDTRGLLPTNNIQEKQRWDRVGLTIRNEAGATSALTILYNIDQAGWVTAGSLTFNANIQYIVLGRDPLPWEQNLTELQTKYLSLEDAPPGYVIQIRYVSEDTFSRPSILDVSVQSRPIGPEFDNEIA